jgi:Uma2 family endonuclease
MFRPAPNADAFYTWDDFIALEDEDLRELIDGQLLHLEEPTWRHARIVAQLAGHLVEWCHGHGGYALGSGFKLRVSDSCGIMPDAQLYRRGNEVSRDQNDGLVRGHPDLVIEISLPESRRYDRVTKLRWYLQLGVPEYWIIDPEVETLERFLLRDGGYAIATALSRDEIFRPETFAGIEIPLASLWKD